MKVSDIIRVIEDFAPLSFQESYDNAGLLAGDARQSVEGALLCLDVTDDVVSEAIEKRTGLIISHHPLIFGGIRKVTADDPVGRVLLKALQNNISVYAAHTNIDKVWGGVNSRLADKLRLVNQQILTPAASVLRKMVVFVPVDDAPVVREALFNAGAGHIGEYDQCSFNISGEGSFRGGEDTNPYTGSAGNLHFEKELRIETIYPEHLEGKILSDMIEAHPYEEVAYDIYPLCNSYERAGMGIAGELEEAMEPGAFLDMLKDKFKTSAIRHTSFPENVIKKVAVCGGSGSQLTGTARRAGADVFVSGDFKYHEFFAAGNDMMIADIGHYESEQFTMEIFHELITKKFPNFAVHFSGINTNPIHYWL